MFGLGKQKVLASPVKELVEMLEGEDADKYFKVEPFSRGWVVGTQFKFEMRTFRDSILCMNNTEDQYSCFERRALSKALQAFVDKRTNRDAASREGLADDIEKIRDSQFEQNTYKSTKRNALERWHNSLDSFDKHWLHQMFPELGRIK